jgi:hypothetical protein
MYDVSGRLVVTLVDEMISADTHQATFRADGLADEESVNTLMGHVSMNKSACNRKVPKLIYEGCLLKDSSKGKILQNS